MQGDNEHTIVLTNLIAPKGMVLKVGKVIKSPTKGLKRKSNCLLSSYSWRIKARVH